MKNMRSFMDDEVGEPVMLLEVLRGNVARSVLAETDKVGSILAQQFPTQVRQIEVCQGPG
jgi:hypothetical protein